ncbi:MAG TPA: tetratricopeptide repeat protein [Streptosporangiaceae bacterium]|nr:tetratricopeptide repeat protein [Streptosporangiaceae bacterium]
MDEGVEEAAVQRERAVRPGDRLLLVVDYAEMRAGLEALLKAAMRDEGHVRVLLLARHAGDWWDRLGAGTASVRDAVAEAARGLTPLGSDLDSELAVEAVVWRAVPFFAARLGVPAPDAGDLAVTAAGELRVLDLHSAALVAVLQSCESSTELPRMGAHSVLEMLLAHERHYWRGQAEAAGLLDGRDRLSMRQLSQVVAAACLLGARTARELSRRIPGVEVTEAVALWLRELYPSGEDGVPGMLRPDRLAELHVTRSLAFEPDLALACLTGLDAAQARRALVFLARASASYPAARTLLEVSLSQFPEAVSGLSESRDVMIAVADAIPYPSPALAPAHAAIATRILATYRPEDPGRVPWLNTFGVLAGDLGRREEALTAIEEAITSSRLSAEAEPDAFLPDLAMLLNNQSNQLLGLERREEALAAVKEAVTIRRALARTQPAAFLPRLAGSLNNAASCLSALGQREEALAAVEEALTIRRALARTWPAAFLPGVAMSLNNLASCLSALGQREEALAAVEEAVTTYRTLARTRPDAFLPDLALSLNNLASCLSGLEQREEALTAIEEALTIRRALAYTRRNTEPPEPGPVTGRPASRHGGRRPQQRLDPARGAGHHRRSCHRP